MFDFSTLEKREYFIFRRWFAIAGLGYAAHQSAGRGAVVIDMRDEAKPHAGYTPLDKLPGDEFTQNQVLPEVKRYNPRDEVVCMVISKDYVFAGRYGVDHTPPTQIYRMALQSKVNVPKTPAQIAGHFNGALTGSLRGN